MAKILRKAYKIFGSSASAAAGGLEQFGGLAAGAVNYTVDVETLQALTAWADGWSAACLGNNSPVLEERNAVDYVHGYQIGYLLQQGIPEWLSTQTYYKGNYVVDSNGDLRKCDVDNSLNDDPSLDTTGVRWLFIGNGKATFPLFYFTFADHKFNDANWLCGDTFSWQSGALYVSAYNHLVNDIQDKPVLTETVAGFTIGYYLADDGHKIVGPNYETVIEQLFTATGVAWYYILDTTNQRFKMPRSIHGNIVEKYESDGKWCRVWSDGWCEQGGSVSGGGRKTVTYLKPFANTNYTVVSTQVFNTGDYSTTLEGITNKTSTSVSVDSRYRGAEWYACGYISNPPENSQYKYLYFYVGNTIQDQTTIDVGEITEDLNGKADIDLGNLSNAGKIIAANIGMPSNVYENLTLGTSGTKYQAPADGYFYFSKVTSTACQSSMDVYDTDGTTLLYTARGGTDTAGTTGGCWCSIQKGRYMQLNWDQNGALGMFRFVYAEGSKSLA